MNKEQSLTPEQWHILRDKGTEPAFSGQFIEAVEQGSYLCRQCGKTLFRADSQFTSQCGWPSFDDELQGTIKQQLDADGCRSEIVCANCNGHLGHVFTGENYTQKNLRYCVNSVSIEFVPDQHVIDTEEAIVAGGCFWGVEYLFQQLDGVLLTEVGYSGGELQYPTYRDLCGKTSGHLEVVRVVYDPRKTDYQQIIRYFFEIHDFTQVDGQGPDVGSQYLSAIFYFDEQQKTIVKQVITELVDTGYLVATGLYPVTTFWPAEKEHQAYYLAQGNTPYCHTWRKIFK